MTTVTYVPPDAFAGIVDRVRAIDDGALNEAVWRDLEHAQPDSAGFLSTSSYAHVARSDNFAPQHWALGVAGAPRVPVLEAALAHVARTGGGTATLWVLGATDADDAELADVGLTPARDLHEMRVPLPIAQQPQFKPGIEVRTFEPGRDEDDWLAVNNRAFSNHAEQGGWIRNTLERRMADPWFDPSLFFLAFDADGLAGFNWLKVHDAHGRDPQLGEIFVIGVDPRMQGSGLGRALALHGLAAVADRGITTGSLFVAADNAAAHHLYEALGFTVHRVDRAYERNVTPA
ncbi:MAG TPA: mycothiol synthase [Acidimicrobiia bacterium]|nr:mycothiol synthase [Acidimicrobiia bacterium]